MGIVRLALLAMVWVVAAGGVSFGQGGGEAAGTAGKKVIHWGFDAPGATYFCQNIEKFQAMPFDGYVLSLTADIGGKKMWTGWGAFGGMPLTAESLAEEMDLLAKTDFGRVQDNLLRLLVTCLDENSAPLGAPNLLDDGDWARVLSAARLFARVCKVGKVKGILFDDEQYGHKFPYSHPFDYRRHPASKEKSFAEFARIYRQRGREFMEAVCREKPDIVVLWLVSNAMVYDRAGRSIEGLETCDYGLLPAFHDGMVEGAGEGATLIDGNEIFYPLMRHATMKKRKAYSRSKGPLISQIPDLYRKRVSFGVGLMADINYNFLRDFYTKPDQLWRNHFSPERLMHAVHNALVLSDRYVWVWSEKCVFDPQVRSGVPPAPPAYHDAIANAHTAMDLNWEPKPHPASGTYPSAKELPGYSEAETFGELLETHEEIMDLSRGWQILYDPELEHPDENFQHPERLRPLRTDEYFQNQGFPYQGASWSRLVFEIPESAKGRELSLVFGGVRGDFIFIYAGTSPNETVAWQMNDASNAWKQPLVFGPDHPVVKALVPGKRNMLRVYIINWAGPGGIFKPVKLLAGKDRN